MGGARLQPSGWLYLMNNEPTTAEKLRALPWDVGFSAANSVFVQFTYFGSAFVLFLSELGLSKSQMGSLLSLLPFSNLIALFVAPTVARYGYKRSFVASWSLRTGVTVFMLLTPVVSSSFGTQVLLLYVTVIVAIFAIWRSIGMTARLPWVQEFVPDSVRGKFSAVSNMFAQLTAFIAVIVAGYVIERSVGLTGFMILFAVGTLFGAIAVWSGSHVSGGAPTQGASAGRAAHWDMLKAVRDRNFLLFLVGVGLIILATGPLGSFVPLFMQEDVGLSQGQVVWLQNGALLGGLVFSFMWGWLADRYGGKPVMTSGIALLALTPIFWFAMPRDSAASLYVALVIAFLLGAAGVGWEIGSMRLRFVAVIPPDRKANYQALYYAWIGIVGGLSQLMGGRILDASAGISGEFLIFSLDSYSILFFLGIILPILAGLLLGRVRADSPVTAGEFAAMFFRGNPFMALESMIRFHRARDERAAVSMTERLGRTESPLTVEELLEALSDPRFNVRFEAIISIARRGPDERLTQALVDTLSCNEPALSAVAAWALGRIGDERAIEPLRAGLGAEYRSVRAHCARSLGTLGDADIMPVLLERLEKETDVGLQLAFSSALGNLRVQEATDTILLYLRAFEEESARSELALALARVAGDEHPYIQLLRHCQQDAGTATSQAVTAMKRAVSELDMDSSELLTAMDDCAYTLARDDLEQGVALLCNVIRMLPKTEFETATAEILEDCADCMELFGTERMEYVTLALHAMRVGLAQNRSRAFGRVFR
jgi:HEAT repeat protein/MFS family permease